MHYLALLRSPWTGVDAKLHCMRQVKDGSIDVDQSALTGESLPVTLRGGDAAQMGATVTRGEVQAVGARASSGSPPANQSTPFAAVKHMGSR